MKHDRYPSRSEYWDDPWDVPKSRRKKEEPAPQQPEGEPVPAAGKKKKRRGVKVLMIFLIAFVIAAGLGTGTILFLSDDGLTVVDEIFSDADGERSAEETASAETAGAETAAADDEEDDVLCYLEQGPLTDEVQLELHSCAGLEELSYEEIYANNINSVVSIVSYVEEESEGYYTGTGIIISSDGYIVTNEHVIEDSQACYVTLQNDFSYQATLVGLDVQTDLAVLKIEATGLTPAVFADSSEMVVGNSCVAIGNPLGVEFRGTMTTGIISALNRNVTVNDSVMTLIQTDCAINSGNSGGPLINMYGEVIGICNMKMMSSSTTVEGLGFAIPSKTIQTIVNKLLSRGEVVRAMLGLTAYGLNASECFSLGIDTGICVATVDSRSDAFAQGIREGDVILMVDGQAFGSVADLNAYKQDMSPGETLTLTILRDGETFDVTVTLMDQNELQ